MQGPLHTYNGLQLSVGCDWHAQLTMSARGFSGRVFGLGFCFGWVQVRVSALHRDVARVLGEQGVAHAIEHLTPDRLFSVDIALPGALDNQVFPQSPRWQSSRSIPDGCSRAAFRHSMRSSHHHDARKETGSVRRPCCITGVVSAPVSGLTPGRFFPMRRGCLASAAMLDLCPGR